MIPTLQRRWQFDLVYDHGRKRTYPAFVFFHLERAPDRRAAFVASRKVGGAVQRNRAKRVLRAALAEILSEGPGDSITGWIVLVARRSILTSTSTEIAATLRALFGSPTQPAA